MKLRYYADAPNYDNHERILDFLHTIHDRYGITVEIDRVNRRYDWIQAFPGEIRDSDSEEVYDRDFHYNRTLGSNIGPSPSQAFRSSGRHVSIDGYVGVVDDGLVWATTHRGDPIGYDADIEDTSTTLGFLDHVVDHGLEAIEATYMDEDERERSVIDSFLAGDVIEGSVHRDVTVGTSLVPDHPAHDVDSSVGDLVTRTVEAIIEADDGIWVIQSGKTFDATMLDTVLGQVRVRDRLYRLDNGLDPGATKPAVVFNTVPWELDVDGVPSALDQITAQSNSTPVHVFVGQGGEFHEI